MRKMDFRMERPGLVKPGDHVDLKEDVANTMAGIMYYYTIREAVAMSNNTKQRLKNLEGTVTDVIEEEGIYTVWVEITEQDILIESCMEFNTRYCISGIDFYH